MLSGLTEAPALWVRWVLCLSVVVPISGCASLQPATTNVRDGDPIVYLPPTGEVWIGFENLPRWRQVEFRGPGFGNKDVKVFCIDKDSSWLASSHGDAAKPPASTQDATSAPAYNQDATNPPSSYDNWKICKAKKRQDGTKRDKNTRLTGALIVLPAREATPATAVAPPPAGGATTPTGGVTTPTAVAPPPAGGATTPTGGATTSATAVAPPPAGGATTATGGANPQPDDSDKDPIGFDRSDAICIEGIGCSRPEILRGYRPIKHLRYKKLVEDSKNGSPPNEQGTGT